MNDWVVETPSFEDDLMNNRVVMLNQNGVNRVVEIIKDKDKEIERLNNIINGMEKFFKYEYDNEVKPLNDTKISVWTICQDKLQELKMDSSKIEKQINYKLIIDKIREYVYICKYNDIEIRYQTIERIIQGDVKS